MMLDLFTVNDGDRRMGKIVYIIIKFVWIALPRMI